MKSRLESDTIAYRNKSQKDEYIMEFILSGLLAISILCMGYGIIEFIIRLLRIDSQKHATLKSFKTLILPLISLALFVLCIFTWHIGTAQRENFENTTKGYAEEPVQLCNYHKQLRKDKQNIIKKQKSYQKLPSLKFNNQQVGIMSLTKYNHYLDLRDKDIKAIHHAKNRYRNDRINTPFIHNKKTIYKQRKTIKQERQKFFIRNTQLDKSRTQKINHKLNQEHFTQYDIR